MLELMTPIDKMPANQSADQISGSEWTTRQARMVLSKRLGGTLVSAGFYLPLIDYKD